MSKQSPPLVRVIKPHKDSIRASLINQMVARQSVQEAIRKGLSVKALKTLEAALDISQSDLTHYLHLSVATLSRRREAGRFNADESDRILRFARLKELATAMMQGDSDAANRWLKTPRNLLGGETPMEHAQTEWGAKEVETLIGRIEHGVFS